MTDVTILMPVYDERDTVEEAVERTLGTELPVGRVELILIDDGSTDGTSEVLHRIARRHPGVQLVRHTVNRGKGAALRTGLQHASGRYTAVMDADLEYDAADMPRLIEPLLDRTASVVFGTRGSHPHSVFSLLYVLGNKAVAFTASGLYDTGLVDIMTGLKAMPTELFRSLRLRRDGFDVEAEITARALLDGHDIYEVPISYSARRREAGKKLTAVDGLRVMRTLIGCRIEGLARK